MAKSPDELRTVLRGLFSFPITPFTQDGEIDLKRFREHLGYLIERKPSALFICGGTGEFFSINLREYQALVKSAVEEANRKIPVVAGVGYGTRLAKDFVKAAEEERADAVMVMPPYLLNAEQEGLYHHFRDIAISTSMGVIVYQRDNVILDPGTVRRLAEIPNVVALKDGHGDMERLIRIRLSVGDRLVLINGMPTAEMSAPAFLGVGITNYSSAVFNFVPEISWAFYNSLMGGDKPRLDRLMQGFYQPFAELRDRKKGYAISLVKAGLKVLGKPAGRVRPPLINPSPEDEAELARIIESGLSLMKGHSISQVSN
jgi:5-dehydro-4-deoxyglucarate dehydratase